MSKRIRYRDSKKGPNFVESIKTFTSDIGAKYKVFLDLENKLWFIKNIGQDRIIKQGGENINNLNVLKRTAKQRLTSMGVSFDDESRFRTFGLCKKGQTQEDFITKK